MSFLEWLESIGPEVNWIDIRDRQGLPGIEKELRHIITISGYINLEEIYNNFLELNNPWCRSTEAGLKEVKK